MMVYICTKFHENIVNGNRVMEPTRKVNGWTDVCTRAREIVGFAGSGPIFETENRFISRQDAQKSVHKTLSFSRFCNTQTDIVTCQNCSHLIIRCYLS